MLEILVIEDNVLKREKVISLIREVGDESEIQIDTSTSIIEGKAKLSEKIYDLVILDLNLPLRDQDQPDPNGGRQILIEIGFGDLMNKPVEIVGLTGHQAVRDENVPIFSETQWSLIDYQENASQWRDLLKGKVTYRLNAKRDQEEIQSSYLYDFAIITALHDTELRAVLKLPGNWTEVRRKGDSVVYHTGTFTKNGRSAKVVVACANQMGMAAAAVTATKMTTQFRPKYLVMTGIAAGVEGKTNLGDVLVPTYSWDYGSGKVTCDKDGNPKFEKEVSQLSLDSNIKDVVQTLASQRRNLNTIYDEWEGDKPETVLNVRVGPVASGASVIELTEEILPAVDANRKLLGVEMEAYGVFYAAYNALQPRPMPIVMKSVCDFANLEKNDKFQKYASYTSARFFYEYAMEYLVSQ